MDSYDGQLYDVDMAKEPYQFADIISFRADLPFKKDAQFQGRLVSMYARDPELKDKIAVLQLLYRPRNPKDSVTKHERIFEYWESDEVVEVEVDRIITVVPWVHVHDSSAYNFNMIRDEVSSRKELKQGVIAITHYLDGVGRPIPAVDGKLIVEWYQFDPDRLEAYPEDLTNQFWSAVKTAIFDPYVSPLSRSARRQSKDKNRNLWAWLVQDTDPDWEWTGLKLRLHNTGKNLLENDLMIYPNVFLPMMAECIRKVRLWKQGPIYNVAEALQKILEMAEKMERKCNLLQEKEADDVVQEESSEEGELDESDLSDPESEDGEFDDSVEEVEEETDESDESVSCGSDCSETDIGSEDGEGEEETPEEQKHTQEE